MTLKKELIRSHFEKLQMDPIKVDKSLKYAQLEVKNLGSIPTAQRAEILLKLAREVLNGKWNFQRSSDSLKEFSKCFIYYAALTSELHKDWEPNFNNTLDCNYWTPRFIIREMCACIVAARNVIFRGDLQFLTPFHQLLSSVGIDCQLDALASVPAFHQLSIDDSAVIVGEGADLDGVADLVVSNLWSEDYDVEWPTSVVLLQESIYEHFLKKLRVRLTALVDRESSGKFKNDDIAKSIDEAVEDAKQSGVKIEKFKKDRSTWSPTIFHEYRSPSFVNGTPVLSVLSFRSYAEAVKLFNHLRIHFVSLWGSNISQMLSVTEKIDCETVWINRHGLFSPALPIFGYGGYEGVLRIANSPFCPVKLAPASTLSNKTNLMKLASLDSFKIYHRLILRWAGVLPLANKVPSDVNILRKVRQPRGNIYINWATEDLAALMEYLIPALSCGNTVTVYCPHLRNSDLLVEIQKALDVNTLFIVNHEPNFDGQIVWNNDQNRNYKNCMDYWHLPSIPDERELLSRSVFLKYIWLPESC